MMSTNIPGCSKERNSKQDAKDFDSGIPLPSGLLIALGNLESVLIQEYYDEI
jgi:hypothetical protein